jgi:hypothetical protein
VQVEPVAACVGGIEDRQAIQLGVAHATKRRAGSRPERHQSLNGRRGQTGQRGRLFAPRVRRRGFVCVCQAATCQQACDPPLESGRDGRQLPLSGRSGRVKPQRPCRVLRIYTIEHKRMHVHVEIQGRPEPLDDRHGAATTTHHTLSTCPRSQIPENRSQRHAYDCPTQRMVPGDGVPHAGRQAYDPLAHRDLWEHMVDQVGRALRHATPATARTKSAPLARERDESVQPAVATVKARKASGQPPAAE